MQTIKLTTPATPERTFPTLAETAEGELFLVFRTYAGKDATMWALNMNTDGERVRYDELVHHLAPVGTEIQITV